MATNLIVSLDCSLYKYSSLPGRCLSLSNYCSQCPQKAWECDVFSSINQLYLSNRCLYYWLLSSILFCSLVLDNFSNYRDRNQPKTTKYPYKCYDNHFYRKYRLLWSFYFLSFFYPSRTGTFQYCYCFPKCSGILYI